MTAIADASPVNILVRIGFVGVLPVLFEKVLIPTAVAYELNHSNTPAIIRKWMASKPDWLEVRSPAVAEAVAAVRHQGERQAIELALELKSSLLIIDEKRPRTLAIKLGIPVVGTIGVLEAAANRGVLADLREAFDRIMATDFRVSDKLLNEALERHSHREGSEGRTT